MRTLVTADIHGGYKTLIQCFERSKFDYNNDRLIVIGDVCDGWNETKQVIDELLKVKNLIFIIGNHDVWVLDWMEDANHRTDNMLWVKQGGRMTLKSYEYEDHLDIPIAHIDFLKNKSHLWYEENGILFVHGGININSKVESNMSQDILWDRELITAAWKNWKAGIYQKLTPYKEVWVGHTSTWMFGTGLPLICNDVIDIDTGGGYEGKLTIMDLETKKYWQSDKAEDLYIEKGCKICTHPKIHKDGLCEVCWIIEANDLQKGYSSEKLKTGMW